MRTAIALLVVALGASVPVQGAGAADRDRPLSLDAPSQSEDFSAKKKKRVYVYGPPYGYYHSPAYYPAYRAYAADPSWQSPDMLRRRAIGECIIDLGYGRWESCSNAGPR